MLSERKNIINEFSRVLESNKKANSACKNTTREISCENYSTQLHRKPDASDSLGTTTNLKEIKLREAVTFLQRKNQKQSQELLLLSEEMVRMKADREDDLQFIKTEKDKSKRMQATINNQLKIIADLKKKNEATVGGHKEQDKKINELETKIFKLKELLRKKECQVVELQEKNVVQSNLEEAMLRQKEELQSMRENYFKIKSRQNSLSEENELLKEQLSRVSQEKSYSQEKAWSLEEINKRLQDQCSQLEALYDESKAESDGIERQLRALLEEQAAEISRLTTITSSIKSLEIENEPETSVYLNEILRVLKQVPDRNLRGKLERQIEEVIVSLEESWNRILMQVVSTSA